MNFVYCSIGSTHITFFVLRDVVLKKFLTRSVRQNLSPFFDYINSFDLKVVFYIASVCSDLNQKIRKENFFQKIYFLKKDMSLIESQYGSTLGLDRFLLLWYLLRTYSDFIVFDLGTAWTVDEVCQGVHQGGQIILGLSSFQSSYSYFCPQLPSFVLDQNQNISVSPYGLSTQSCLSNGLVTLYESWLRFFFQKKKRVIVTGGDSWVWSYLFEASLVIPFLLKEAIILYASEMYILDEKKDN